MARLHDDVAGSSLARRAQTVAGVFISYRRDDSAAHVDRLYERLTGKLGTHRVFMDIDAIEPGMDFVEALQAAAMSFNVVLVIIGRQWSSITDDTGRRRLESPLDFVRLEVES